MGIGVNHENKKFKGDLEIKPLMGNLGVLIRYKAVGTEGFEFNDERTLYNKDTILYNEEITIICRDSNNEVSLWTLNSNIGTMHKFDLRRFRFINKNRNVIIFGFGGKLEEEVLREEITIETWENGDISYNYSWGDAEGVFISRSTVRMKKIN